jgi:hypothetical protein
VELYEQEQRIRVALGIDREEPLPNVGIKWLRNYFEYLVSNLSFPFEAQLTEEVGYYRQPSYSQVTVMSLVQPDDSRRHQEYYGLICTVRKAGLEVEAPLVDLEVAEDYPNFQLIEDYWYWIWNWRFDPQI